MSDITRLPMVENSPKAVLEDVLSGLKGEESAVFILLIDKDGILHYSRSSATLPDFGSATAVMVSKTVEFVNAAARGEQ